MAFQKGFVEVQLEVTPAPGCFLSADPSNLVVAKGDLATFILTATPQNGFAGPIFLRAVNLSAVDPQPADPAENSHHFTPNPIPAGGGQSIFTVETDGWPPGPAIGIGIEALDVLPAGEYPVT